MASRPRIPLQDHTLAMFLVGSGAASLVVSSTRNANMWWMSPGIDGVMCMGLLGFALMILHGIDYRTTLTNLLPIFGIQLGAAYLGGASGFTIMGLQALVFGLVGLLVAQPAKPTRRRAKRRKKAHRHHGIGEPAVAA